MINSRQKILHRLRQANKPFPAAELPAKLLAVTPLDAADGQSLTKRFIREAEALACVVQLVADDAAAVRAVLAILDEQQRILAWNFRHIPCAGLQQALHEAGVAVTSQAEETARSGITGAEAGLAATGSLVLVSGPGRERTTALLPESHIVIIRQSQIVSNFEAWLAKQRQDALPAFQQVANINIISGPSRTADIAMELILGMHGPANLHIIVIKT
jgi:L-lactate dehydrogenase complex protein LldG